MKLQWEYVKCGATLIATVGGFVAFSMVVAWLLIMLMFFGLSTLGF